MIHKSLIYWKKIGIYKNNLQIIKSIDKIFKMNGNLIINFWK